MNVVDARFSGALADLASIAAGYPFRGKIDDLPAGKVAVIQMRNVDPDGGVDWKNLSRVTLPRESPKALLRPADIILSTRGGRNFAYLIGELQEPAVCSPHFFVIRARRDAVSPGFLAWQMNQKPAQEHFIAGATGSHILNLKREVVETLPLVIPPLLEQKRIVDLAIAAQAECAILARLIENRTIEMAAIAKRLLARDSARPEQRAS